MKEGDAIVINKDIKHKGLKKGTIVTIMGIHMSDVLIEHCNKVFTVKIDDVDPIEKLPIGTQLELGEPRVILCDCGGFKTYKSMEPEYHSETLPCSSLRK
jgi:hypothetical protein